MNVELFTLKVVWEGVHSPFDILKSAALARAFTGIQHKILHWNCGQDGASYFVFCLNPPEKIALLTSLGLYSHIVKGMIYSLMEGIDKFEIK